MTDVVLNDLTYSDSPNCYGSFDYSTTIIVIILSCVLGIVWAGINFFLVRSIRVDEGGD